MIEQQSLFPEPEQVPFDVNAAARRISEVSSTPEHQLLIEKAYDRRADREGLIGPAVGRVAGLQEYREMREKIGPSHRPLPDNAVGATKKYTDSREKV